MRARPPRDGVGGGGRLRREWAAPGSALRACGMPRSGPVRPAGSPGRPFLTAHVANVCVSLAVRIRPNHSVASLPGFTTRDRGVLALRGHGSRGRSRPRRRRARLSRREGPKLGRRRHVRVIGGGGGLVGADSAVADVPVTRRDEREKGIVVVRPTNKGLKIAPFASGAHSITEAAARLRY